MKDATQLLQNQHSFDAATVERAEQQYIDNAGKMETAADSQYSEDVVDLLADSFTSPVQVIKANDGEMYYGVIEWEEGSDEWYGFYAHDRVSTRRVVGTREAADATDEADLPHVTAADETGSFADEPEASYQELATRLDEFYNKKYGEGRGPPESSGPPDHTRTTRGRDRGRVPDDKRASPPGKGNGNGRGNGN